MVELRSAIFTLSIVTLWMSISAGMINFNKFLLTGPFPHPEVLVAFHMFTGFVMASVLVSCKPDLFPTFQNVKAAPFRTFRRMLPIGVCFATSLIMSNKAYQHCPVGLLQMMKEGNIPIVFVISLMAGIERFESGQFVLSTLIFVGALMATSSAAMVYAPLIGIAIQLSSQVAEVSKMVVQSKVLSGDRRLDPMTMMLCMSPVCLLCLTPAVIHNVSPVVLVHMSECMGLLAASCALAFLVNCMALIMMKQVAATGMVLAGSLRAISIVAIGSFFWHEPTTNLQNAGFALEVVCIAWYSIRKAHFQQKQIPTEQTIEQEKLKLINRKADCV